MNKIDQIKDLFQQNYFFYAEEIEKFVEKARFMKEEGLNVLIDFLNKAKQHQDRFFAERINKDPNFNKNLDKFLRQKAELIKQALAVHEKKLAEEALNKNINAV